MKFSSHSTVTTEPITIGSGTSNSPFSIAKSDSVHRVTAQRKERSKIIVLVNGQRSCMGYYNFKLAQRRSKHRAVESLPQVRVQFPWYISPFS